MTDVYKKLARHLDNTPGGFPETPTGIELKILKQLFTPQEAQLALSLIMLQEPAETIANRAGEPVEDVLPQLLKMAEKGLILHNRVKDQSLFMQLQFVVGIWEYQVNRLTESLIRDFNEYVPYLTRSQFANKTQQLRVVPVRKAVTTELAVMDYERLDNIIRAQSKILVAPCICRKEHLMSGEGCGKLEEACLMFGSAAHIYENRGIGRVISQDEALDIIQQGIHQGLVPQPTNSKKPINICLCCSCCCQILKNIKAYDAPAQIVHSNYQAIVDNSACTGCQSCEDICPMDAIDVDKEQICASVNLKRCIGCGLCVTACLFDAIKLMPKAADKQVEPPTSIIDTYMTIAKEKGLI